MVRVKGFIIGTDEGSSLGGVHIFAKKTRRGFIGNSRGLFEVQVVPGDTLIFSHIGYETARIAVPEGQQQIELIVRMRPKPIELPNITIESESDIQYLKRSEIEKRTLPWYWEGYEEGEIDVPMGSTSYGPLSHFSREAREKRKLVKIHEQEMADRIYTRTITSDSVRMVFMDRYGLTRKEFDKFIIYYNSLSLPINRDDKTAIVQSMHKVFLSYIYEYGSN